MSEYYMSHSGSELDEAISKVKNGYLNPADLITHTTKSASGQFTGSGEILEDISIEIGFKPKIFLVQNLDAVYTGSDATPYSLVGSVLICDNEYSALERRTSFVLKGNSTNGWGRGGQSGGNGFLSVENGVKGVGATVKTGNGVKYNWWAWG